MAKKQAAAERIVEEQASTAVAIPAQTELALPPAEEESWGMEEMVGRDNVAIPFLGVLQPLSPQVNPSDSAYIDNAKPGQIYHSVNKTTHVAVQVIPCFYYRSFIEWVPRDAGGGFRGEHRGFEAEILFNEKLDRTTGKARLDNGNDLVDTRNYFVLLVREDGTLSPAMISMSSTQIKASKTWNAAMRDHNPIAKFVWQLTAVMQENKKGKWFGWNVKRLTPTPPEMLAKARDFYLQVKGGEVTVDRTLGDHEEPSSDDASEM